MADKYRKTSRFKVRCLECRTVYDSDHRKKHNQQWHKEMIKSNKYILWEKEAAVSNLLKRVNQRNQN